MPFFPSIPTWDNTTLLTTAFGGLNRGLSISDGEMSDMTNMTSDNYPVLSTRKNRGVPVFPVEGGGLTVYEGPVSGMLGTDRLIVCTGKSVYMDGEIVPVTLSDEAHMQPKRLVSMGAYVCIWPDKKYFNVTNLEDAGEMGTSWTPADGDVVSAVMCRKDGTNYDSELITISDRPPEEPEDQQFWLDTSGSNDVLKQYSAIYQEWVQVATTYIKIQATGIGKGLKDSDVVHISGASAVEPDAVMPAEDSEETLTFSVSPLNLYSKYTTTIKDGSVSHTTASTSTSTREVAVSGIPDGAKVVKAIAKFTAGSSAYGAALFTCNGHKCYEKRENEVPLEVTGNGSTSIQFKFRSNTTAPSAGSHSGTISISNLVVEVTYGVSGGAETPSVSEADKQQMARLNTTNIVYARGDDYIIVAGLLHNAITLEPTLKVELKIPDLDYVCEANNRLWGCSYSEVDGRLTNEIRACALGDFRNWYKFEGTSMDSYVMSVGSDGPFTAAYSLRGTPLLWKEDYLHKVSGTQPSNFTLNTTKCRGVQAGSWKSLAVVNEILLYKARNDVMAYDGAMPYSISEKLGTDRYNDAVGGASRDKYYINMQDEQAQWHVYAFDTSKGLWHKEDNAHIPNMASMDGGLVLAVEENGKTFLRTVGPAGESNEEFDWSVTFGVFGYAYERAKYLSRFNVRAGMSAGSEMTFEIMYDSNGEWVEMGTMESRTIRTFTLPIIPRRCDHCQIRIRGRGKVDIYSIARVFEEGGN